MPARIAFRFAVALPQNVLRYPDERRIIMGSGPAASVRGSSGAVRIRRATPADAETCGRICYEAFRSLNTAHGFPPDFPAPELAIGVIQAVFSHPRFYCVVAEAEGRVIGSNCLDERNPIAGIGPITVDPAGQNRSTGRMLMQAVLDRAAEKGFAGTRLVQTAFHNRSLSLYAKLGFVVREPLSCVQGSPLNLRFPGYALRPARREDLPACNALCFRVHGHDRGGELADGIERGKAVVVEHEGRIAAYASVMAFFGHGVAESSQALKALIGGAPAFEGPGILIPSRQAEIFRWCLDSGLRVVQPMTLMSVGLYNEPCGAWFPSVLY